MIVSGLQHNGRVAAFGPGDPGSNPGEDRYIIEFKSIIQVVPYKKYKPMIALASNCDPAIGGSLVGGDKQPLKLQKFGDALQTFTLLNGVPESSRHML